MSKFISSTIIPDVDEEVVIEHLHGNTLSDNPVQACSARLLKEVMPVYIRWFEGERDRRTPADVVGSAVHSAVASMIGTCAINLVPPKLAGDMVEHLVRRLAAHTLIGMGLAAAGEGGRQMTPKVDAK